jgi:hypothetical protein
MSANQPKLVQRQHGQHSHQMSVANPGKDMREMYIPSGTIVADTPRNMRLPFPFLRTWIMSLLALLALPIGLMLVYVGMNFLETEQVSWFEQTATVTSAQDEGIRYRWDVSGKTYDTISGIDFERLTENSPASGIALSLNVCDLVAWWVIPTEPGTTFPLWVNPLNPLDVQCVPMTIESAGMMVAIGAILAGLSALRLLRTIGSAAVASAKR